MILGASRLHGYVEDPAACSAHLSVISVGLNLGAGGSLRRNDKGFTARRRRDRDTINLIAIRAARRAGQRDLRAAARIFGADIVRVAQGNDVGVKGRKHEWVAPWLGQVLKLLITEELAARGIRRIESQGFGLHFNRLCRCTDLERSIYGRGCAQSDEFPEVSNVLNPGIVMVSL